MSNQDTKKKLWTLRTAVGLVGRPAMDYLWTEESDCPHCGIHTKRDYFVVIHGSYVGLGAPWFIAPFLKRASTQGKKVTNGIKGEISMCQKCFLIKGEDEGGMLAVSLGYQSIRHR